MNAMIGLEVHIQLLTESKLFCACSTKYQGKEPNNNTCPICLGFPGAKPKLNKKAVEMALKISLALGCEILPQFYFSRKSYFYPDMPKNYQISQYESPISRDGRVIIAEKDVRLKRIHLEEDPARLIHVGGSITNAKYTLIDYNRAGMSLIEIVTEPDISSPQEARQFLQKLSLILEHLGAYDPSLEGSMRIDANVSLIGGQRVEVKNITGFRNVESALHYEIIRQESMAELNVEVDRETRHYDSDTNITLSLRKKEHDEDYGYIVEPDLVRIEVEGDWLDRLKSEIPELPESRIERFVTQYGIPQFQSNIIVNTGLDLSEFFEECLELYDKPDMLANWIVTFLLKSLNYEGLRLKDSKVRPKTFIEILEMIDKEIITERLGKELIKDYVSTGESPQNMVIRKGLTTLKENELRLEIDEMLDVNEKAVNDYFSGREKALDFLLGQALRRIKARGDPVVVKRLIKEQLVAMKIEPR